MVTDDIDVELAPGHRLTGAVDVARPPADDAWRYSCSCGEIAGVDTAVAQAHSDEVTP